MMVENRTFKPNDAAQYIGCKYGMIMDLVRQNKIPHYRIGRRVFFKEDALAKWIDDGGTSAQNIIH